MSDDFSRPLRVGSSMADTMAKTLFDMEPPLARHQLEKAIRLKVCVFWEDLYTQLEEGAISQAAAEALLDKLDIWMRHRLSGQNVLFLVRKAEERYPDWIRLMPRTLAARYEELRVARNWSALLNPEALNRLRTAIEMERSTGDESGV